MTTNIQFDPFSETRLAKIFQTDPDQIDKLLPRESSTLEFKENFNLGGLAAYARTMAAFANSEGGYLVFGVKDNPRLLLGMANDQFEELKPENFKNQLGSFFTPDIHWDLYTYVVEDKRFGLIYTYESKAKPVIAKATYGDGSHVQESDIYYRYEATSERIRYPELTAMLLAREDKQLDQWRNFLQKVVDIGVENAAVLNLENGELSGSADTIVISEDLLDKIKFIQQGSFSETDGEPTLRLIGDVEPVSKSLINPGVLARKTVGVNTPDIISAFLEQVQVEEPRLYFRQACHSTVGYLPIYYFMHLAGMSVDEAIQVAESQKSTNQGKTKIINRLQGVQEPDRACKQEQPSETHPSGAKALDYYEALLRQDLTGDDLDPADLKYLLRAFRVLDQNTCDSDFVFPLLKQLFDQYYANRDLEVGDDFRRAICYLDCMLYQPEIEYPDE
ncbi:MAG: ATP-binding protein [Chloroflexota bacterium]